VRHIAISPDSRWVVTASHGVPEGMKLWDAQTGRLVHDFPSVPDDCGQVWLFSPDGRWLAVWSDGWVLFETSFWTIKVRLSRGPILNRFGLAFAPDSYMAAYGDNAGTTILAEVETGCELARFEDPEQAQLDRVEFTPDGSQMVTTLVDRPYLRVWDLRAIRRRLAEMHLDWGSPATFDTSEAPGSFPPIPKPFRVDRGQLDSWLKEQAETPEQVVERTTRALEASPDDAHAHHNRAHALFRLKRYEEAVADFTSALKASPSDLHLLVFRGIAETFLGRLDAALADCDAALRLEPKPAERNNLAWLCNNLAWALVAGPESTRDERRALSLARRAVELARDEASHLNTLGVALYRNARYAEAVPILERSLAAGRVDSDAFDLFFLAMTRHRLGEAAAARADFDKAAGWLDAHPNLDARQRAELKSIRAEASSLLFNESLPADPFAH
jgi:tetratricopeptide (TPR) repeat protein